MDAGVHPPGTFGDKTNHEVQLEDTGERCLPWMGNTQVIYEHLHRYHFAKLVATGRRVLDLGCGEGYGAAILADAATEVLGVDVDPDSIKHARRAYERHNLRFEIGSIDALDAIPEDTFDVVVCFEVIEHIHDHDRVIAAVRRVLCPGGIFLVSTPDRDHYNAGRSPNPFHVRELSADELSKLLDTNFSHQSLWTQHLAVGSALRAVAPARSIGSHIVTVTRVGREWKTASREDVYVLAAASDRALPDLPDLSLLEDRECSIIGDAVQAELRILADKKSAKGRPRGSASAHLSLWRRARRMARIRRKPR